MDHDGIQRPSGKLESLPKDELLKFIKRQAINSKELKKKISDLEDALNKEKEEVSSLELEKKEWISRGVSAEFEKKDKNKTVLVEKLHQDNAQLGITLTKLQGEFEVTVLESQELRDKLQATELQCEELKVASEENSSLKGKIKELENQLANPTKYNKLKEEYEELGKANKLLKDDKMLAEQDRTVKSEQILNFDKDIKNLRQELAEKNKVIKDKKVAMDALKATNGELSESLKAAEGKCQGLQAEIQKHQQEKEKYLKAIKSMKTKMERTSLIEEKQRAKENTDTAKKVEMLEELKNQISTLELEKTELKEVIESQNKKTEEILASYEKQRTKENTDSAVILEGLKNQISSLELENAEMKEVVESRSKKSEEILANYENLQMDIEKLSDQLMDRKELSEKEKEKYCDEKEALSVELMKVKKECEGYIEEKINLSEKIANIEDKAVSETVDLNAEVQHLQEEIEMFKRGAPETKATIVKLESRVYDLLNQLQTLNEEKLNQESALEELFKSHDDLSNKYDFECKEREKNEKEISHLEEQLRLLQAKDGKEKSTVDLEQQIDMLEETINEISVEKDHYRKELVVKEECIQQLRNDIEEVRKKNANTNTTNNQEIEMYSYEVDNIRTQLMSVTNELDISNNEKESIQSMMVEVITERDSLNESLEMYEENMSVLKSQFDVKALECEELKQQVIEHSTPNNSQVDIHQQEEMRNLQSDLDYLDAQYKQVSKENILLKEEFQTLVATKTEYQNDLDEIKIKLDEYMKEKTNLKNEIVQYNELTEKYGYDNVIDFDMFVSSLSSDVATSTRMLQCLTAEKEQMDTKYIELESKLKTDKSENIYRLENELLDIKNEIQNITDQNVILINEKDNTINEKDKEINERDNKISKMDTEIEQLHNSIKQYQENWDSMGSIMDKDNGQFKGDVEAYKEEVSNLNETISNMNLELLELKTSEENRANEIREKHILIGELKAELIGLRESSLCGQESYNRSEDLHKELHEKEQHIMQLSENLKESQISAENLKSELDLNSKSLKELVEKYEEVQENYKHLQDINACLEENYASLQSANVCILGEKKKVLDELNQVTVVNKNVENKLQAALDKVVSLQNDLQEKDDSINELNSLLKEKGNKGSKFKTAAVKAKKELEVLRQKYQDDTTSLEQQVSSVKEEVNYMEQELSQQKTECSRHEEEFEEFQAEIKTLQTQLLMEQESLRGLQDIIKEKDQETEKLKASLKVSEEELKNKCSEVEKLKPAMEDIQKHLDNAVQEKQQHLIQSLEIGDYERTVDSLQSKLDSKEKELIESRESVEKMAEIRKNMENEIASFKKENADIDNKNEKLKAMIVKLKKDISDKQKQQQETMEHINELETSTEQLKQTIEELKLKVADLNAEKSNLNDEMKSVIEQNGKQYQTLEVKFARASNDLLVSQRENTCLAQEFEQYKVRAHNVLKQQKSKQHNDEEEKAENLQIAHLDEMVHHLKLKLEESNESCSELEARYQELQVEYDGLQARHHEYIEEIGEKEFTWKQKLTQVKLDASTKVLEYQDKLQLMQNENESLTIVAQEKQQAEQQQAEVNTELLKNEEKEKYEEEINRLLEELAMLKRKRLESPPNVLELQTQDSIESKNESVEFKSVSERQEGEGMDSRELEIIDTLSQRGSVPHTPSSPTHASILERLLSPVQAPQLASPQTPGALKEELVFAKTSLQTAVKKNEHMTALIRESEANACRLADQAKVLKEEIRRLERNEEREQALSNMEYLKNVIIKFLKVGAVEKEQLIPVLSTMLKLSEEEKKFIFEYAKGESGEDAEDNSSWSSYVYRWTSLS